MLGHAFRADPFAQSFYLFRPSAENTILYTHAPIKAMQLSYLELWGTVGFTGITRTIGITGTMRIIRILGIMGVERAYRVSRANEASRALKFVVPTIESKGL